ncbi:hypothetical protein EON77_01870 [bacterium]|nr:MAG: hypothetical protein EON77_01870 [bacterium]
MRFIVITKDEEMAAAAREGFHPSDELALYEDWRKALDESDGADLMILDMLSTLDEPHKVAGYEKFAQAKMSDENAKGIPLVLISPDVDYEMDFVLGWPDFVFANVRRPVNYKMFRRASTWV